MTQLNQAHTGHKRTVRSRIVAAREAARAAGANLAGYFQNRFIQPKKPWTEDMTARRDLMHGMTNWQRSQALKHCRGKMRDLSTDAMRHFAALPHWKQNGHQHNRAAIDA